MDQITVKPAGSLGRHFIPSEYLPKGKDEHYLRNLQNQRPADTWRKLRRDELECLIKNGNFADCWDDVLVTEPFDPRLIANTRFYGLVRIGRMRDVVLEHHDLQIAAGIRNSSIISCDIGDDAAIDNVSYLAHYIIGDRCILADIDEMHTTNYAKFGNGIVKEGEPEKVRVWMDLMNECGCRQVMPFDGMITADAYLWAKYRDDKAMQSRLKEITQQQFDLHRGYYGTVGDQTVIKNSQILKDVKIGSHAYIKGANKLKNLTINSSSEERTQIGEGVELVNGIIGYGCHIFYGCKAVRFILGSNSSLKYGARLIHSFLGANSTISCCEVLNNLIFPAHEQHHNNSFLIASVVMGQSNMAAGATVGSNHNSRTNDNEVQAGRGFWPGLCTSIKHSSRFASFTLLAKGAYPCELNIPLPFALVNDDVARDRLEVMPAFWWLYNMYALARNKSKFQSRDKRITRIQNIEFEPLAPDTAEEILLALGLLERWTAIARLRQTCRDIQTKSDAELREIGRTLLTEQPDIAGELEVLGENMEKSRRKVLIVKPCEGYNAYGQMLLYYAVRNLLDYMNYNSDANFNGMKNALQDGASRLWVNLGGQLTPARDVDQLRADIGGGTLNTWQAIHERYDALWKAYPLEKQKHAFAVLRELYGGCVELQQWQDAIAKAVEIQRYICDQVYLSRQKDFENPFRKATYRNEEEMLAALGTIEDNSFVKQVRAETEEFIRQAEAVAQRG
jgi:NDP-sugar pyrophosphorylase family protein